MFILHIESISASGWELNEQADAGGLPLLHALSRETPIHFTRPVQAQLHARRLGDQVAIDGTVKTTVVLTCSRCLEHFEFDVETNFSATAVPERPLVAASIPKEEIELSGDAIDVILYEGESVDLRNEIAQQIIMALPFKPLCQENCKGLCSHCGTNLNQSTCTCQSGAANNPFAVLKSLKLPNK